jgi:hypothetical protein
MVGGSLTSSARVGAGAASARPAKATVAKFISRRIMFPQFISPDETFYDWDNVIARLRWQRPGRFTAVIVALRARTDCHATKV